ncbi:MAG: hypothetical protein HXY50_03300 [Ignavibacteriaceae bacterium]|nr:hypothetical protein [Ignavibacteriaceae bacterium]
MNSKNMIQLISISLIAFITITCYDSSVNPQGKVYTPGPRNYTWKIYSLNENAPFNHYTKIWGSEPNNIWIVGSAGDFDKTILRFNGQNVTPYGSLSINPTAVYGFSNNDVWFAGQNFDMWRYNGSTISKFSTHQIDSFAVSFFGDIWGTDDYNVFAVGSATHKYSGAIRSIIMHFDGSNWTHIIEPESPIHFVNIRRGITDPKFFLMGYKIQPNILDSTFFYEFDGKNFKSIDVGFSTNPIAKSISLLDGITYFINGKEMYKSINGLINHYTSFQNSNVTGVKIWGRTEKDFFIQTQDGIGHYNGTDVLNLYDIIGDFGILDGLVLENDVYFVGFFRDTLKYFLIHGILQ